VRRLLHRRVAQALETVHAGDLAAVSGQLAVHFEQAGLPAQAIPYYYRAATVAQRVYANEEAIGLLRKGLALLEGLPASPERDATELSLQTALGATWVAREGYDSAAGLAAYSRASQLCQRLGLPPSPPILRGLAIASIAHGRMLQAHAYGSQLRSLAEHSQDPVLTVEADYVHGVTWFWQGDFAASRTHLEEALSRYNPEHAHIHLALYSQDPRIVCLIRLAFDLWCLGFPEQAERRQQQAVELAQALAHPLTLGYTHTWCALLHNHRGDPAGTRQHAGATLALDPALGVPYWSPFATVLRGWARVREGRPAAGWDDIHAGLAALQAGQRALFEPYFKALVAELHALEGQTDAALALLGEALSLVAEREERWCEADLWRRQGELLLAAGDAPAAEAALLKSLGVAREQHARAFELRAAVDLARLWQGQGALPAAHRVLSDVLAWFTEGLDQPELVEARRLLEQLASSSH
jgi:predicted ATPase